MLYSVAQIISVNSFVFYTGHHQIKYFGVISSCWQILCSVAILNSIGCFELTSKPVVKFDWLFLNLYQYLLLNLIGCFDFTSNSVNNIN